MSARTMNKGFTLIEVIVILAVISILAAILTPTVLRYISDAQASRAEEDVRNISAVLNDVIRDTGQFPGSLADNNFLCGPGSVSATIANGKGWADALTGAVNTASCAKTGAAGVFTNSLSNHLLANDPNELGGANEAALDYRTTGKLIWKGPYVQSVKEDPWGNAYQVNVSTLKGGNTSPTWVISAGPDGIFQTANTDTSLSGDDIGTRIK